MVHRGLSITIFFVRTILMQYFKILILCFLTSFQRPDFIEKLGEHLEDSSKQQIAESLPFDTLTEVFMKNVTNSNTNSLITRILNKQSEPGLSSEQQGQKDLSLLQDYLSERFASRDLILFCSQLLEKIHNKS